MLTNIEAVLFDLDGTLLDRRRSFKQFVRDQRERFDALRAVDVEDYVRTFVRLDRDGYAPRESVFQGLVENFGLKPALGADLLRDYRAGFAGACVLFPDVVSTLTTIRAAGMKLGMITNGSVQMQSRKLDCLALADRFDAVVISAVEGVHKPDPRIFQLALNRLGTAADRSVFVGDHPEVDVAGARSAGMVAIWRRDPVVSQVVDADVVIDQIEDLSAVLGLRNV